MKVGVLGTGDVGRALGKAFITLGHEVRMGAREPGSPKATSWASEAGPTASAGTFEQTAEFGELIVLATLGVAVPQVIAAAHAHHFRDKIVLDTTNPLDFSKGFPPSLARLEKPSGGELVQSLLPQAKVVKVFNTVGHAHMFKPSLPGGPPTMFFCGDDEIAKSSVADLLRTFGWEPADVGGITASHYLEAMCIVWVLHSAKSGSWDHAFKML